ncbi:MAG: nicotinamide-nucleotide amidohydrolase family protein [Kiritimatiellaeota bacterium]|nr:nicotinamide-nucleotide amidohydrolase family protein [Kiritimatiellota bacterium]
MPPSDANLITLLRERGLTLALAESCTGGMAAMRVTAVPGASDVFLGGVVSYANAAKRDMLGVPQAVLDAHGAVSTECAAAMAEGARQRLGADIAVSVTGIAGPGGGTPLKPVGLVFIGVSTAAATRAERHLFPGDRPAIRRHAADAALAAAGRAAEGTQET